MKHVTYESKHTFRMRLPGATNYHLQYYTIHSRDEGCALDDVAGNI